MTKYDLNDIEKIIKDSFNNTNEILEKIAKLLEEQEDKIIDGGVWLENKVDINTWK